MPSPRARTPARTTTTLGTGLPPIHGGDAVTRPECHLPRSPCSGHQRRGLLPDRQQPRPSIQAPGLGKRRSPRSLPAPPTAHISSPTQDPGKGNPEMACASERGRCCASPPEPGPGRGGSGFVRSQKLWPGAGGERGVGAARTLPTSRGPAARELSPGISLAAAPPTRAKFTLGLGEGWPKGRLGVASPPCASEPAQVPGSGSLTPAPFSPCRRAGRCGGGGPTPQACGPKPVSESRT